MRYLRAAHFEDCGNNVGGTGSVDGVGDAGSTIATPARWIVGRDRLKWRADVDGLDLYYGPAMLARVVPDATTPGMYRILVRGQVSDMTNVSRAKDAAVSIALGQLNLEPQERP